MTQDEIIEMAKQSGIGWGANIGGMTEFLEAFAKLVAAKEREECAKIAEQRNNMSRWQSIAAAIRARGQQ